MGTLEKRSRVQTRKNDLQKIILASVQVAGLLSVALVAPNVLQAMKRFGMVPSSRQGEVVRRSYGRLVSQGLLEWHDRKLRLTKKGAAKLRALELSDYKLKKPARWDKKWRVLIFDIPERRRALRDKVRNTLRTIGFVQLQGSVWIFPYDCEDLITLLKADFKIGKDLLYMIVDQLEYDTYLRENFKLHPRS